MMKDRIVDFIIEFMEALSGWFGFEVDGTGVLAQTR